MRAIFTRAGLFDLVRARYDEAGIETVLRREFGEDRTLGSPDLRCLLLLGLRNTSTGSPWPVSSNPAGALQPGPRGSNLDLPLWQLIRASSAAPTFFVPEEVDVGGQTFVFSDGAVTTLNNPALQLVLMATLPAYRLGWPTGRDELLLVSVGTGTSERVQPDLRAERPQPAQLRDRGARGADPQRRRAERLPVPGARRVPVTARGSTASSATWSAAPGCCRSRCSATSGTTPRPTRPAWPSSASATSPPSTSTGSTASTSSTRCASSAAPSPAGSTRRTSTASSRRVCSQALVAPVAREMTVVRARSGEPDMQDHRHSAPSRCRTTRRASVRPRGAPLPAVRGGCDCEPAPMPGEDRHRPSPGQAPAGASRPTRPRRRASPAATAPAAGRPGPRGSG